MFLQSVIQCAREGTDVVGLFCQNEIESFHATEKRIQFFNTISILIERRENEEVLALHSGGRYVLS